MTKEIPGYKIIEKVIKEIDEHIEIEKINYDSGRMTYILHLVKDSMRCKVPIQRELLDDINDYSGLKESKYWVGLEGHLRGKLSIAMQKCELIPFSSDSLFYNPYSEEPNQEIQVEVESDDYEIYQGGLKRLRDYLEAQKTELSYLKLGNFPYEDDLIRIKSMIAYREEREAELGQHVFRDRISIKTRMHLKAAAIAEFIFFNNEMKYGNYSKAVNEAIAQKLKKILNWLSLSIFEKIILPDYMSNYEKENVSVKVETKFEKNETKEYDVVLSFAGEDRDYAGRLAALLKKDNFDVFYDEYEEHDLWGKNLYDHLTEIYSKRGKYCVMFLSKHYAAKQWPNLERKAAQERAFKEHREYILPIRIDDTEIPGMLGTVGCQDLREKSIEQIYDILKHKLEGAD